MNIKTITVEELKEVLLKSKSMREVILSFGLSANGSSGYTNIKNKIKSFGLPIPKYNFYGDGVKKRKYTNNEVFVKKSSFPRQKLKARIIKEKLIEYKCVDCSNVGFWNNKKLSLQLDHENGVNDDNRIENLRFLCPNCHTQTETYSGKANKK